MAAVTGHARRSRLKLLGRAPDVEPGQKLAERMWRERDAALPVLRLSGGRWRAASAISSNREAGSPPIAPV